jgi:hypothetical protein
MDTIKDKALVDKSLKFLERQRLKYEVDVIIVELDDGQYMAVYDDAKIIFAICGIDFDDSVDFPRVLFPSANIITDRLVAAGYSVVTFKQYGSRDVVHVVHPGKGI